MASMTLDTISRNSSLCSGRMENDTQSTHKPLSVSSYGSRSFPITPAPLMQLRKFARSGHGLPDLQTFEASAYSPHQNGSHPEPSGPSTIRSDERDCARSRLRRR